MDQARAGIPESIVAAVRLAEPAYPQGDEAFSPELKFPEYQFPHLASSPNPVYAAVRQCLAEAGLDRQRYGSPEWNPLGEFVGRGGRVFVLCNFVYHRRRGETLHQFQAKCTHASVIRPIIDLALKAVGPEGRVEFGNAPLQGAVWQSVLADTGAERLVQFYQAYAPGQVAACDLRGQLTTIGRLGTPREAVLRPGAEVLVDLGSSSLLESAQGNRHYRVSQYDPRQTEQFQGEGRHIYAVSVNILRSDLVISVPKLKTHEKVGLTGAIKGCVGAIALKQSLAHHRKGPPQHGGDEFPRPLPPQMLLSALGDAAWSRESGAVTRFLRYAERALGVAVRRCGGITYGSWSGNDTCWRMAVDCARCVVYARADGSLAHLPVRKHIVLTDGIIGGEGEGPLRPTPVHAGWLLFASDPVAADCINALAMGYDPRGLPMLANAAAGNPYGLPLRQPDALLIRYNGEKFTAREFFTRHRLLFRPPSGWLLLGGGADR